jgi:alpha-mannosidase
MSIGQRNLNYAIQAISWDINIEMDVTMKPIVVFNPHCWTGMMVVDLEVRGLTTDNFRLTDDRGNVIPAQRIQSEATVNGQSRLLFVAKLPSLGYKVFKLYLDTEVTQILPHVSITETSVENDRYRLEFNIQNGCIRSFYDKKINLEILSGDGARLAVMEDKSDTWAHHVLKFDKEIATMEVVSVRILEDGPVRSTMRVKSRYNTSYVIQDFKVYKKLDYIEVKMNIDWREPQTLLKLKYPVNVYFSKPTYEIPYGYIEKSSNGEEEPGQTWIDYSGINLQNDVLYGLGIANDSKYSYSFDIYEMAVTLLRNSVYAHHDPKVLNPEQDYIYQENGTQEMNYILLPHEGGWKDSEILRRAMETNQKPLTVIETYHEGSQPQKQSFVQVDCKEVVITVMKEAEDKDGIILRAYETMKHQVEATIEIPFIERTIILNFKPLEIKTVKIPYDNNSAVKKVNMLEFEATELT